MDRLRCIDVFNEVARGLSFTAAAERLGMSKGNVTKHVAWLENSIGVKLLTRTTKTVRLTDAGTSLLEHGQHLLDRYDAIEEVIRSEVKAPQGTIRIGTPPSFGAVHLVPIITAFTAVHPDIHCALHLDDGKLDLISEGLDLSVRIAPSLRDTSLAARKLGSAPQVLVASPAYLARQPAPHFPADLDAHDCLVNALKSPTSNWILCGAKGRHSVRVSGSLRANFGEPLRHAALLGQGISMHPTYMVAQDILDGRLLIVLPDYPPIGLDIYAIYPHGRAISARVRLFLDFLSAQFPSVAA